MSIYNTYSVSNLIYQFWYVNLNREYNQIQSCKTNLQIQSEPNVLDHLGVFISDFPCSLYYGQQCTSSDSNVECNINEDVGGWVHFETRIWDNDSISKPIIEKTKIRKIRNQLTNKEYLYTRCDSGFCESGFYPVPLFLGSVMLFWSQDFDTESGLLTWIASSPISFICFPPTTMVIEKKKWENVFKQTSRI